MVHGNTKAKMSRWPGNAERERTTFGGLTRGALMSRVRSSGNATTEQRLLTFFRSAHITGWRRNYPLTGKPDFVFSPERLAVFADGCFWHGHNCGRKLKPKTNATAWRAKIRLTKRRDRKMSRDLRKHGWRVLRFWECALSRHPETCLQRVLTALSQNPRN